jgi:hypothetical protein
VHPCISGNPLFEKLGYFVNCVKFEVESMFELWTSRCILAFLEIRNPLFEKLGHFVNCVKFEIESMFKLWTFVNCVKFEIESMFKLWTCRCISNPFFH